MTLDTDRLRPKGKANRLTLRDGSVHTPFGIFSKFIPHSLFEKVATHTNVYAEAKCAGAGRKWRATTSGELKAFVGLTIYMGIFKCPRLEDYWDRTGSGPLHSIMNCMTLYRFQQLKRFLHIYHPSTDGSSEWFFNKFEPLISHVRYMSKKLWVPAHKVSVDIIMFMNYGRSAETVRMRNNPIGAGFKLWALSDAGYVVSFYPHSNRNPWKDSAEYKSKLSHSSAVVARLRDDLPRALPGITGRVQYVVFMDN